MYSNLYPLNESSLFVIPAELTDRVNNFVYLPERHSIHLLVQLVEVRTDLFVIIRTVFVVTFILDFTKPSRLGQIWVRTCFGDGFDPNRRRIYLGQLGALLNKNSRICRHNYSISTPARGASME